ncbi:MAG: haloacid dehalogenase [Leptospiraceae bacterium]|nr:MAG: haloacid dehalogenase [Leptospiraceae bacterium]
MNNHGYAIFDLDYTLIPHDTIFLFANYILKKQRWKIFYLFFVISVIPLAILKIFTSKELKQVFLSFIWHIPQDTLDEYAKSFVKEIVIPKIYPELLQEIKEQKIQKKILILNTASPDFYAKYIGEELGFDYTIATPILLKEKQSLFPKIIGENNKSYAKIKRMQSLLPENIQNQFKKYNPINPKKPEFPFILKNSISYSDSIADLPLLRLTEKAKIINPENQELIKEAKIKNWEILTPQKPFKNKFQKYFICFLQSIGLYL